MKEIEKIAENKNYTAINIGDWNDLKSYSFIHPPNGQTVTGKIFLKELTKSTGTEISLSILPPNKELGYFHIHNKDEETYIKSKSVNNHQTINAFTSVGMTGFNNQFYENANR